MFLGLDLGTQSLKAILISQDLSVVDEFTVNFQEELRKYFTLVDGVRIQDLEAMVPTLMWVEALDLLFQKMKNKKIEFDHIKCISGSAQQHGSVYWKIGSKKLLKNLNPEKFLYEELKDSFIVESPIWMDSSTQEICDELEKNIGGVQELSEITGSRAYCRFTLPQITKQFRLKNLENCERISLISSFLGSLFLGEYMPIDFSDASGMNLFDIKSLDWSSKCFEALQLPEDDIRKKLGTPIQSSHECGNISDYFIKKYGFHSNCLITAFSGDNPNSACFTLRKPDDISVSLGTSNTIFGYSKDYKPNGKEGHVFISPFHEVKSDRYLIMSVFKNGGIVKNEIKENFNIKDWNQFDEVLIKTKPGNDGNIGFYYKFPEITPTTSKSGYFRFDKDNELQDKFDQEKEIRAVIESQFMSLKIHGSKLGLKNPKRIITTGGASKSKICSQILSDIFDCPVYSNTNTNSAPFGAALRALHSFNVFVDKTIMPVGKTNFKTIISELEDFELKATPNEDAFKIYQKMEENFIKLEEKIINQLK
eukprot:gene6217-10223_t